MPEGIRIELRGWCCAAWSPPSSAVKFSACSAPMYGAAAK